MTCEKWSQKKIGGNCIVEETHCVSSTASSTNLCSTGLLSPVDRWMISLGLTPRKIETSNVKGVRAIRIPKNEYTLNPKGTRAWMDQARVTLQDRYQVWVTPDGWLCFRK